MLCSLHFKTLRKTLGKAYSRCRRRRCLHFSQRCQKLHADALLSWYCSRGSVHQVRRNSRHTRWSISRRTGLTLPIGASLRLVGTPSRSHRRLLAVLSSLTQVRASPTTVTSSISHVRGASLPLNARQPWNSLCPNRGNDVRGPRQSSLPWIMPAERCSRRRHSPVILKPVARLRSKKSRYLRTRPNTTRGLATPPALAGPRTVVQHQLIARHQAPAVHKLPKDRNVWQTHTRAIRLTATSVGNRRRRGLRQKKSGVNLCSSLNLRVRRFHRHPGALLAVVVLTYRKCQPRHSRRNE